MTAQELFKRLGYSQIVEEDYLAYKRENQYIAFVDKEIELNSGENVPIVLSLNELKAIIKQCIELWEK